VGRKFSENLFAKPFDFSPIGIGRSNEKPDRLKQVLQLFVVLAHLGFQKTDLGCQLMRQAVTSGEWLVTSQRRKLKVSRSPPGGRRQREAQPRAKARPFVHLPNLKSQIVISSRQLLQRSLGT